MKRLFVVLLASIAVVGFGCTPALPEPPIKKAPPEAPGSVPLPTRVQPLRDLPKEPAIDAMDDDSRRSALQTYLETHELLSAPAMAMPIPEGAPLKTGAFMSHAQTVSGGAWIVRDGDRAKLVLSSDFATLAGPDLRVVATSHGTPKTAKDVLQAPSADLGPLQGTSGAQVYDLGPMDPASVHAVAIYSNPFQVVFGWAELP